MCLRGVCVSVHGSGGRKGKTQCNTMKYRLLHRVNKQTDLMQYRCFATCFILCTASYKLLKPVNFIVFILHIVVFIQPLSHPPGLIVRLIRLLPPC